MPMAVWIEYDYCTMMTLLALSSFSPYSVLISCAWTLCFFHHSSFYTICYTSPWSVSYYNTWYASLNVTLTRSVPFGITFFFTLYHFFKHFLFTPFFFFPHAFSQWYSFFLVQVDFSEKNNTFWKALHPLEKNKCGEILTSLMYQPSTSQLTLTVIKCRNLKAKDINGKSGLLSLILSISSLHDWWHMCTLFHVLSNIKYCNIYPTIWH